MSPTVPDLWGELNLDQEDVSTPAGLLRQQAALLSEKTNHRVIAEVIADDAREAILLRFVLRAPAIPNYQYELFFVRQDLDLYPVWADGERFADRAAFQRWLAAKLSSRDTRRKIKILMETAGSQAAKNDEEEDFF